MHHHAASHSHHTSRSNQRPSSPSRRRRAAQAGIPLLIAGLAVLTACDDLDDSTNTSVPPTIATVLPPTTTPVSETPDSETPGTTVGPTIAPTTPVSTTAGSTTPPTDTSDPTPTTAPDAAAGLTVVAFSDDGTAIQVPMGDSTAAPLFDLGTLNDFWEMIDVSFTNKIGFVGTCCEPATGAVYQVSGVGTAQATAETPMLDGYGVRISPNDRFVAIGSFVDNPISVRDLTTGELVESDPAPGWVDMAVGEFTPADVLWIDDTRLLVLGSKITNPEADAPEYVVYDVTVDDTGKITSVSDALPTGQTSDVEHPMLFAGSTAPNTVAIHQDGATDVVLFDLESKQTSTQPVGDKAYSSVWYDQGDHLTTVDTDGELQIDGTVIPGTYAWARTT